MTRHSATPYGYCHGQTRLFAPQPRHSTPGLRHIDHAVHEATRAIAETPLLSTICAAVPDRPRHATAPRAVTARALLAVDIAFRTLGKPTRMDALCDVLSTDQHPFHLTYRNRLNLGLQPGTRITRAMIHHTAALIRHAADVVDLSALTAPHAGTHRR